MASEKWMKMFLPKDEWKPVAFNADLAAQGLIDGLAGIEELTDYELVGSKKKQPKTDQHARKQVSNVDSESDESLDDTPVISKKRKACDQKQRKPKKKKFKPVVGRKEIGHLETLNTEENIIPDDSLWKSLCVPEPVTQALINLGYTNPTAIQTLVLPSAIRDKRDIIGAAETGSGKTLAFGIPIISKILQLKAVGDDTPEENTTADESKPAQSETQEEVESDNEPENVDAYVSRKTLNVVEMEREKKYFRGCNSSLNTLILTPTRELAIQVKNHLQAAARLTGIKVQVLVGGMAPQKQLRLLRKCPEIVIATPGRLWEFIQEGHPYLKTISEIQSLVIDEADRMLEKGHFTEMIQILDLINSNEEKKEKRQNFIFSATLTLVHDIPIRFIMKKRKKKLSNQDKLEIFMKIIGIKENPKIIDLTKKEGTAEMLVEAQLNCALEEKDYYLYYFLIHHPGRTLVFCNSIDCVRRLISVFTLLQCNPHPLHADMHQKQRLKNLERFSANEKGLLIATDVAARGLDIPNIEHVIHYQVPKVSETYVHRSGRTARATKEGLSVMFISPEEIHSYRHMCRTLKREEDLLIFPVNKTLFSALRERVTLARALDKKELPWQKRKCQNNWFRKTAEKMDLEIDEDDLLSDSGDEYEKSRMLKQLKSLRNQLNHILKQPIGSQGYSGKFPTKSGKLIVPELEAKTGAIDVVKDDSKIQKNMLKTISVIKKKKKQRRKKKK